MKYDWIIECSDGCVFKGDWDNKDEQHKQIHNGDYPKELIIIKSKECDIGE